MVEAVSNMASLDPLLGRIVNGRFAIERIVGQGSMGRVYEAVQAPLGRRVAVKTVLPDCDPEDAAELVRRFVREASLLAKLQHPNVVSLFDYGVIEDAPGSYFMVLELLEGETFRDRLRTRGRLLLDETLAIGWQIARGLRAVHARGIVHRDLKPGNVMLLRDDDGRDLVKLVDFGIGKEMDGGDDASDITCAGAFVGTPKFMAPEQFEARSFPASDVHALGTLLYVALAGDYPFAGESLYEIMGNKLDGRIRRELLACPEPVADLLARMMASGPEDRPTSAAVCTELARFAREWGDAETIAATAVPSAPSLRLDEGVTALETGQRRRAADPLQP